jgi:hypothetical protein
MRPPLASLARRAVAEGLGSAFLLAVIRPADAPGFVLAQLLGAAAGTLLFAWLLPIAPPTTGGMAQTPREPEDIV